MSSSPRTATFADTGFPSRGGAVCEMLQEECSVEWLGRLSQEMAYRIRRSQQQELLRSILKNWLDGPNRFPRSLRRLLIEHACKTPNTELGTLTTRKEFYRACSEDELCRLLTYHTNKAPFGQAVFDRDEPSLRLCRAVAHQATGHGSKRRALRGGLPEEALRDEGVRAGLLKPHQYGGGAPPAHPVPRAGVLARLLPYSPSREASHELIENYIDGEPKSAANLGRTMLREIAYNEELPLGQISPEDWMTLVEGAIKIAYALDERDWAEALGRLAREHPDPGIQTVLIRVQCSSRDTLRKVGFRALAQHEKIREESSSPRPTEHTRDPDRSGERSR